MLSHALREILELEQSCGLVAKLSPRDGRFDLNRPGRLLSRRTPAT